MPFLISKTMTDKEAKRFYNSISWKRKRINVLERDHYECQDCVARLKEAAVKRIQLPANEREIRKAADVHHIKGLKEYPELGLDDDNLISLCIICHNIRHGRTVKKFKKRKALLTEERW